MKVCCFCKENVADDARFCGKCGKKLENVCECCGTPYAAEDIYCQECGNKLVKTSCSVTNTEEKKISSSEDNGIRVFNEAKTKKNGRNMLNKNMVIGFLIALLVITLMVFSLQVRQKESMLKSSQTTQNNAVSGINETKIPSKYTIGNGKIGLFTTDMSLDMIKKILIEQYNARVVQRNEPVGEGMVGQVVTAYVNNDNAPSIKFTLQDNGEIYRITIISPEFHTPEGIHVGSTWGEVRSIYPKAQFRWGEGPRLDIPEVGAGCSIKFNSKQSYHDVRKIESREETYSDDTSITDISIR